METRIEIQQYIPALRPEWDCFIANSRNGTFLFFSELYGLSFRQIYR